MDVPVSRSRSDFAQELTMIDVDVAIVGAGPAGSAAASVIARNGYAVALIDKQNFPREKLCGDFINPNNLVLFRDLGVEEEIFAAPHRRIAGFRITAVSGAAAEARFSRQNGGETFGLAIRRALLDGILLEQARRLGALVQTGCRIERLTRDDLGWRLEAAGGESWRARFLIGADGRNSWVAAQIGADSAAMSGRAVGFQLRLKEKFNGSEHCKPDGEAIEIHLFPSGYAGVASTGDGAMTLGLAIDKRALPRARVKEFLLSERLTQNPFLRQIIRRSEPGALRSVYPVYFRRRRSFIDAALLVGDAARVTEPISGEGVYFALRSGMIAADTLDRALRCGDGSANSLRRYEHACGRAFRSRLMLNSLLRFAVYRPALLNRLIAWSAKDNRLLGALVDAVCAPALR
jgi:geranylgeranyl reductase family protein